MPEGTFLPLYEIAQRFRMSPETIRLWITRGILVEGERVKLPALKLGGSWRVKEDDLINWIDKKQSEAHVPGLLTA